MKPQTLAGITVFVRILLYMATGWLLSSGVVDAMTADEIRSPITIELVAGILTGIVTAAWYRVSDARKALKERFEGQLE